MADFVIESITQAPVTLYWLITGLFVMAAGYAFTMRDRDTYTDISMSFFSAVLSLLLMIWSFWGVEIEGNVYMSWMMGYMWLLCMIYMILITLSKIYDVLHQEGNRIGF